MTTYARLPVTFARGEGAWLWDTDGRQYLDALSGVAVCGLGHAHPAVADALCRQAATLVHTSNIYRIEHQETLGEALVRRAQMDKAFFCNSGAEANEAALKLARLWARRKGVADPAVIVMQNSFHGRTLGTLSATGNPKVQAGFEPLVSGFVRVPYDDPEAVAQAGDDNPSVVAVLVEPVQGEGGVQVPAADYLQRLRALCDARGWLLMLDEVQTGMGRTGRWFAYQHGSARPDVVTLAKALGNGVPIGACLARGPAAELFTPGTHATTFGGSPLACAAALAVVRTLEAQDLAARAADLGRRMLSGLQTALGGVNGVRQVRGLGLMLGIELDRPCAALVGQALDQGLLINVTAERVVRLLPPLILSDEQADRIVAVTADLIRAFLQKQD